MKKGLIYKTTCIITNKIYVGKTCNLRLRKNLHKSCAFNNKSTNYNCKFYRAIRKYGWDNFVWEILENNIDENFLFEKEIKWISILDSYYCGYNSTFGGEGLPTGKNHPNYGRVISQEVRNKLSIRFSGKNNPMYGIVSPMRGKKHKVESIEIMSRFQTGKNNSFYNKKHTKEILNKFSIDRIDVR